MPHQPDNGLGSDPNPHQTKRECVINQRTPVQPQPLAHHAQRSGGREKGRRLATSFLHTAGARRPSSDAPPRASGGQGLTDHGGGAVTGTGGRAGSYRRQPRGLVLAAAARAPTGSGGIGQAANSTTELPRTTGVRTRSPWQGNPSLNQ